MTTHVTLSYNLAMCRSVDKLLANADNECCDMNTEFFSDNVRDDLGITLNNDITVQSKLNYVYCGDYCAKSVFIGSRKTEGGLRKTK